MPPVRSWSELFAEALLALGRWAMRHPLGLLASLCGLTMLVWRRHHLVDRLAALRFSLTSPSNPRRFIFQAVKLIERRARWAGRPRPAGTTLLRWYFPVARESAGDPQMALEGLVRLADWAAHAPDGDDLGVSDTRKAVQQKCRHAVRIWTLERFRPRVPSRV